MEIQEHYSRYANKNEYMRYVDSKITFKSDFLVPNLLVRKHVSH